MISKLTILFVTVLSLFALASRGQTDQAKHELSIQIPEVALIGLVSDAGVSLQPTASREAGEALQFENASSKSVWINYSSIISQSTPKRKVVAFIQGEMPKGLHLRVEASEYSGAGKGRLGKSAGAVVLSGQPSDVIVDIGTCYTGKGASNGHCLTYKLEQDENEGTFALLSEQDKSVNVVYTFTDYN